MNIIQKYYLIIFLILLTSCKQDKKIQPEIELINKEVIYIDTEIEYKYSYRDDFERKKATNLITYKISNPTDKKLLFIIEEFLWHPVGKKIEKSKYPGLNFVIKDSISMAEMSTIFINYTDEAFNQVAVDIEYYNDSIKKMKYKLMGIYHKGFPHDNLEIINSFMKNTVVLNPKETRTFYSLLKLPIFQEINFKIGEYDPFYIPDIEKFDKFQLYYSADAEYLKSILPEFLLKELEDNQIEIFDGILMSNEVPLVKR